MLLQAEKLISTVILTALDYLSLPSQHSFLILSYLCHLYNAHFLTMINRIFFSYFCLYMFDQGGKKNGKVFHHYRQNIEKKPPEKAMPVSGYTCNSP